MPKCISCHKAIVVIPGRAHCFHDFMYIYYTHLASVRFEHSLCHGSLMSTYKPYRNPNNKPIYIKKQSNHPPNVLKQLPKCIAKIISDTSSSKDIFDKSISIYQNALYESGFKEELKYMSSDTSSEEKNIKEQEGEK